ncbi:MAG: DUF1016 family protein [Archaeoglobaceae archaeon]|nr:DUF1016 family protein [Archaeoglobaceae archaeon]
MNVEFVRRIGKAEISTKHLNLTDINGKTYGMHFPPHKTKFIVVDQGGRQFEAQKHHTNQIWGNLRKWYEANNIKEGDLIKVKFDPNERINNQYVLHLEIIEKPQISVEEREEKCAAEIPLEFEKQLEDFIEANLKLIEPGLQLYVDDSGNKGRQYPTDVGNIDLLCVRPNGDFVIIELKRGKTSDKVVGQISRYVGWVKQNLAGNRNVYGIIITHDFDDKLKYAVMANDKLSIKYYRIKLEFVSEKQIKEEL